VALFDCFERFKQYTTESIAMGAIHLKKTSFIRSQVKKGLVKRCVSTPEKPMKIFLLDEHLLSVVSGMN
jgi:hypothetical protein